MKPAVFSSVFFSRVFNIWIGEYGSLQRSKLKCFHVWKAFLILKFTFNLYKTLFRFINNIRTVWFLFLSAHLKKDFKVKGSVCNSSFKIKPQTGLFHLNVFKFELISCENKENKVADKRFISQKNPLIWSCNLKYLTLLWKKAKISIIMKKQIRMYTSCFINLRFQTWK